VHAPAHHQTNDGIHTTVEVQHSMAPVIVDLHKTVPLQIEDEVDTSKVRFFRLVTRGYN